MTKVFIFNTIHKKEEVYTKGNENEKQEIYFYNNHANLDGSDIFILLTVWRSVGRFEWFCIRGASWFLYARCFVASGEVGIVPSDIAEMCTFYRIYDSGCFELNYIETHEGWV